VTSQTVVATANVLRSLRSDVAGAALRGVLELEPDLVGLQEWELTRFGLLRRTGSVGLVHPFGVRLRRRGRISYPNYVWSMPLLGGCVVGARTDRFELIDVASRLLSSLGRADKPDRPLGIEPPRLVTIAVYVDRRRARRVSLLNYHLAPGVQSRGVYRDDRPKLTARHRREVATLQRHVDEQLARGHDVYAVGDSNFDGLRLSGITSAWEGREDHPGTHGKTRKIDDVHGPGEATSVTMVTNASDHKALLVSREI
jgi:hypothetical protein